MWSFVKFVYTLWVMWATSLLPVIAQTGEQQSPILFKMQCEIWSEAESRSTAGEKTNTIFLDSWNIQITWDASEIKYLQSLQDKGFTKIYKFGKIIVGDQWYPYVLGEKCWYDVVKVLSETYKDDIKVFDIQASGEYMKLLYKDPSWTINTVNCTMKPLSKTIQETKNQIPNKVSTQWTLYDLTKQWGIDWKTQREDLAKQAGIENYRGTKEQNLKIRKYLLQPTIQQQPSSSLLGQPTSLSGQTRTISIPAQRLAKVQKIELRRIVGLWGYSWKKDRFAIAKEFGYSSKVYKGTKTQNFKIRTRLLKKISVKQ